MDHGIGIAKTGYELPSLEVYGELIVAVLISSGLLCYFARQTRAPILWVLLAAVIGAVIALFPDLFSLTSASLGEAGDVLRRKSHTNYSDFVFAVTRYFLRSRGKAVTVAGMMLGGAMFLWLGKKTRNSQKSSEQANLAQT